MSGLLKPYVFDPTLMTPFMYKGETSSSVVIASISGSGYLMAVAVGTPSGSSSYINVTIDGVSFGSVKLTGSDSAAGLGGLFLRFNTSLVATLVENTSSSNAVGTIIGLLD